jgi:hypothetical protein
MKLVNRTPFPALAYSMVDTHDQAFDVIVMRATLTLRPDGQLVFADEQLPLCTSDTYHGEINKSSVAQESDLSPFKPKCDVNVIASAHAPGGKPSRRFMAGIRISRPGTSAPRPRGLNPTMAPSAEELARWEKQVQAGTLVCEKLLVINGPRYWKSGLFFGWRLTGSAPFLAMPIRYEYAYGGENRVEQNYPEARNVRKKYRLTPDQRAVHPDGPEQAPVAHEACMTNPVGCGFALPWYRNAMNLGKITAPLIVAPGEPIRSFGKAYAPQGLGIIGRAWQPRLALAGTCGAKWARNRHPCVPQDFNFEYWNGAHPDLQIAYPIGDEKIDLVNLCPHDSPATRQDRAGNTLLTMALPKRRICLSLKNQQGRVASINMNIDTLVIEPDQRRLCMVWRRLLPFSADIATATATMQGLDKSPVKESAT